MTKMIKIDLGCGKSKKEGFVGVDVLPLSNVDIVHNLNSLPYPFKDNSVDEIIMNQVLEHLDNPLKIMEEIYRISKNRAKITIAVPYFRSFYAVIDPTHRNFFGINWFYYFDPSHIFNQKYCYTAAKFKVEKIEFDKEFKESKSLGLIHSFVLKIADFSPSFYEAKMSHLYPLNSITYELYVIK